MPPLVLLPGVKGVKTTVQRGLRVLTPFRVTRARQTSVAMFPSAVTRAPHRTGERPSRHPHLPSRIAGTDPAHGGGAKARSTALLPFARAVTRLHRRADWSPSCLSYFPQTTTRLRAAAASGRHNGDDLDGSSFGVRVRASAARRSACHRRAPRVVHAGAAAGAVALRDFPDARRAWRP